MASGGAPLEFLFELDAKIDGVVKMLDTVDKSVKALHDLDKATTKSTVALDHVEKATRHAADGHQKHASSAFNLGHAVEGATGKVHGLLEAFGLMLVFEGFEKLTEKVFELGGEILSAAGKAERAELSFKLMLGDEAGGELLEHIEAISKFTEFTDDELKGVTQGLLKAGFAAGEIPRALAAGLDIAAFSANSAEGLNEAASALERIKRTGRVDNRVLAGLGFGEKDFLKELSSRTGKSRKTLKKEMEGGKADVTASLESLFTMIHRRTGKDLGAAGVHMSETLQARIKHLKDIPDQMFQGFAKTDAYYHLSDAFGKLADDLSPEGPVGSKIAASLEAGFTKVAEFIGGVDWTSGVYAMTDAFEGTLGVVKAIGSFVHDLLDEVVRLGDVLESVATLGHLTDRLGITSVGDRQKRMMRDASLDPDVLRADNRLEQGRKRLRAVRSVQSLGDFSALGPGLAQGLYAGARGSVSLAAEAGAVVGRASIDGAKSALDAHSPSRAFEDLGRMSGEGYVRGLGASTRDIDDAVDRSLALADSVPAGAFARPATSSPLGPVEVTINLTTNVVAHGTAGADATPQEIGDQVAKSVRDQVREELHSILEGIGIEEGGGV